MKGTIAQVSETMQTILSETAHKVAAESGLVKRHRKVNGANLCQTLVMGWLSNPAATLEELCQTGVAVGLEISPQGLDQRFTKETAVFLQQMLEETISATFFAEPVAAPLLQRFNGVYLTDSSIVQLPDELWDSWRGFGGRVMTSRAALKLQVRLDMLEGKLEGPLLCPGRMHDRAAEALHEPLPAGALHLADLGYWKLAGLADLSAQGCYWLTRLQVQTKIIDEAGRSWCQADFLQAQQCDQLDVSVRLGAKQHLQARLLAVRVPPDVAAKRRRRIKEQGRSRGQTVSRDRLQLADWTMLVTNVPATLLSLDEALLFARLRWQIELLFKLWKSKGQIATWRTAKAWRMLCELYAKLIAMVFQHWFFLLGNWSFPDRSWLKANNTVRQHALLLAVALPCREQLMRSLRLLAKCLACGARINKSRKTPRHYQLLMGDIDAVFA
jgi:hypothetical protein